MECSRFEVVIASEAIHLTAAVIASEAKQSISRRKERMDCFVASLLAMTAIHSRDLAMRDKKIPDAGRPGVLVSKHFLIISRW